MFSSLEPTAVDYHRVPRNLRCKVKRHLPHEPQGRRSGRPRAANRSVLNGSWYVLWTGC